MEQSFHVRSISMPTRNHPTVLNVEEEIQKLSILVSSSSMTAQTMCNGLKGLEDIYISIDDLLHLPGTQQSLCSSNKRRWLEQEVEASIRLLDICASTKDMLVALKEHVQDLQSELRRKGDVAAPDKFRSLMHIRKEAKKVISRCSKESTQSSSKSVERCEASETMKALTEGRKIVVSLLCALLASITQKPKTSRWSLVSKVMQKSRRVSCEEVPAVASGCTCIPLCASLEDANGDELEILQRNLGDLENGLECLYKKLILNRVSILNLLSL